MDDPVPLEIETDDEAADVVCTVFGSRELRALASNAGVSRERGDTMRATAERLVAQDPALAARVIENDREVDMDATRFREERQVGEETITLAEAMRRARNGRMRSKLEALSRAVPHTYTAEVNWEYEDGLTSVVVRGADAFDSHWALEGRAHAILTRNGRCVMLEVEGEEYVDRNTPDPTRQWRLGLGRVSRFWDGGDGG